MKIIILATLLFLASCSSNFEEKGYPYTIEGTETDVVVLNDSIIIVIDSKSMSASESKVYNINRL